jgi:4-carboxymuconolactone decarboxylase
MTDTKKTSALPSVLSYEDVRAVSPALEHYTKGPLLDGLWKRTELSPRDRGVATVAALIARIQTIEMPFHFALALEHFHFWCIQSDQSRRGFYPRKAAHLHTCRYRV